MPPADSDMAAQLFKDPYLFDFLGTADPRREAEVERALVEHIRKFLLELGTGFAFVGRQVRLEVGGEDYPLDLLDHLKLRRYVVIELKARAFTPGDVGQLNLYLSAVDDLLRHPDDQPTIGLLLCRKKNKLVAEYALRGLDNPSPSPSGRPGSPNPCPKNSVAACPASRKSKPNWPTTCRPYEQ